MVSLTRKQWLCPAPEQRPGGGQVVAIRCGLSSSTGNPKVVNDMVNDMMTRVNHEVVSNTGNNWSLMVMVTVAIAALFEVSSNPHTGNPCEFQAA